MPWRESHPSLRLDCWILTDVPHRAQMIEYESRRSKTLDLFEEQRYKLVGDVAVADYVRSLPLVYTAIST